MFDDTLDSNDGVSQQVKLLGSWLANRGHKVSYLVGQSKVTDWQGSNVYSLSNNISVRFNGNRLSMPISSSRRAIKKVLDSEQPDVVHVMVPYSPFLAQRIIKLSKQKSVIVGSFHILPVGFIATLGARLLGLFQWSSLKKVDWFSATSPNAAKFAKSTMAISSQVIPNAIDVSKFSNSAKPVSLRIVFLGRLVPRKGCRQLIEAFDLLIKKIPSAELVIAGDGLQRPLLEKLVNQKNLSKRVKFLGYVKEADKPKILGSATIACFPSVGGESFGVVLLEAMASGSGAVVGGNNPGYQSVLGKHPELMVDSKKPQQLADKLAWLLGNKRKIKQIHRWQDLEIKNYDINVIGAQFEDIYYRLIADKRAAKA